jgi:hypothetical protein
MVPIVIATRLVSQAAIVLSRLKKAAKKYNSPHCHPPPPPHLTLTTATRKFSQLPRDRPAESEQKTVSVKDKNNQQFVTSQRGERNRPAAGWFCGGRAYIPSRSVRVGVLGTGLLKRVIGPCDVRLARAFGLYTKVLGKGWLRGRPSDLQLIQQRISKWRARPSDCPQQVSVDLIIRKPQNYVHTNRPVAACVRCEDFGIIR